MNLKCCFLQKLYEEKVGDDLIELVKGSGDVDTNTFLPHKVVTTLVDFSHL